MGDCMPGMGRGVRSGLLFLLLFIGANASGRRGGGVMSCFLNLVPGGSSNTAGNDEEDESDVLGDSEYSNKELTLTNKELRVKLENKDSHIRELTHRLANAGKRLSEAAGESDAGGTNVHELGGAGTTFGHLGSAKGGAGEVGKWDKIAKHVQADTSKPGVKRNARKAAMQPGPTKGGEAA